MNMFTMAQKREMFAKIKKHGMSALEIKHAFGVSKGTAYNWKSRVMLDQDPPPNPGRQKIFSEASVKAWHNALDEAQNAHQAIPVVKKQKLPNLPSSKEVALTALKLTPNRNNVSLSARQIQYHSKQHGIENVNAQDKILHF
jgi:transposase